MSDGGSRSKRLLSRLLGTPPGSPDEGLSGPSPASRPRVPPDGLYQSPDDPAGADRVYEVRHGRRWHLPDATFLRHFGAVGREGVRPIPWSELENLPESSAPSGFGEPPILVIPPAILEKPPPPSPPRPGVAGALRGPDAPPWARSTWVGATHNGWPLYVQGAVDAIHVEADGRVFTNSVWDERGQNAASYRDGVPREEVVLMHDGYGRISGGFAVTGSADHLFYAVATLVRQDLYGYSWDNYGIGVARYDRRDRHRSPAPFPGGVGPKENVLIVRSMNRIRHGTHHTPPGLAVNADRLYVSVPWDDQVRIHDPHTLALIATFHVAAPKALAVGPDGNVWVVGGGGVRMLHEYGGTFIRKYSPGGRDLGVQIEEPGADYRGITVDGMNRLWACDAGVSQQVRRYGSDGGFQASLGVEGGVWEGPTPGLMGPTRLAKPVDVGVDGSGNVYVCMGTKGTDLRQFRADGTPGWSIDSRTFLEVGASVPGTQGQDMFSMWYRFARDNSKAAGSDSTTRSVTAWEARYPGDIRHFDIGLAESPFNARRLFGRTYIAATGQRAGFLALYVLEGEVLRPVAMWSDRNLAQSIFNNQPTYGDSDPGTNRYRSSWVWLNTTPDASAVWPSREYHWDEQANGGSFAHVPGWDFDSAGGVWGVVYSNFPPGMATVGYLRNWRAQGADEHGNLVYDPGTAATADPRKFRSWEIPRAHFDRMSRVQYVAETDTLYVSGWAPGTATTHHILAGNRLCRYDDFTARQPLFPARWSLEPRWTMPLPYDSAHTHYGFPWKCISSWNVAGNRIFLGHLTGVRENGVLMPRHSDSIHVHRASDGAFLDRLLPGPEVGASISWIDMNQGIVAVHDAPNYTVTAEDVWGHKIFVWRGRFED